MTIKNEQENLLSQIGVVCVKDTAKIYDFGGTFNVIVSGELHD